MALNVGATIRARYRLERLLGGGGMSLVWHAHDDEEDRPVVLKALRDEHLENPTLVARFTGEARTAMKFRHEHAVSLYDVGEADGVPYVVMELVPGRDLNQLLQYGAMPIADVADVVPAVEALAAAHALELVHRDLKPANLIRVEGGKSFKILGGWTNRKAFAAAPQQRPTGIFGSPLYMAPERLRSPRDAGPPADIWSMGIVLYEFLTSKVPFSGETLGELFVEVLSKDPEPLRARRSEIPESLEAIVNRCLARDPKARPNAVELARALAPFV